MRTRLLTLAVLAVVALAPAATAQARLVVGIGDQKTEMFADKRMAWLGIRHARLVVPWFVATRSGTPADRAYVDTWLRAARRDRVDPLIGFGHGFDGVSRIYLPKVAEYRRAMRAFRRRWPQVHSFIAWNEANHCSQPTCHRPDRAARYFDALHATCRTCTIVAADVIDQPNMTGWLKRFRRTARAKPKVYGLHNYLDVNRLRTTGTRRFLRAVPRSARAWITETGGLVSRIHTRSAAAFPENAVHAGRVTRFLMRTARALPRIQRVYLYHWNIDRMGASWDSGLIDERGRARPGFRALSRALHRDPRRAPAGPVIGLPTPTPAPAPPPPVGTNPPPAPPPSDPGSGGTGGGGSGGGSGSPSGDPCTVPLICGSPLSLFE